MSWDVELEGSDGTQVIMTCKAGDDFSYIDVGIQRTDGPYTVLGSATLDHPDVLEAFKRDVIAMVDVALQRHYEAGWRPA
jgi:hypothetical protein